jgi:LuxR family maltose regulon positive regulatory protein
VAAQYFEQEVLGRLAPDDVAFVTHASLLDRMSGPVCDAVLVATGSADRLHRLAGSGAFVAPIDGDHSVFRFHPFFREMLSARLAEREPAVFVELSRRAAAWYESSHELPAAIDYLRAVGDDAEAARLLGVAGSDVFAGHLLDALEPRLEGFPDHLIVAHQAAAVVGSAAHALLGHADPALHWAALAEESVAEGPLRDGASSTAWLATLRALLCRDGVERMADDASAALAQLPSRSPAYACALLLLGVSQALRGHAQGAELTLVEATEHAGDSDLVLAAALAELSLLAQAREEWTRGEDLVREARDVLGDGDSAVAGLVLAASARSALRNSNWVRVDDDLDRFHSVKTRLGPGLPWLAVQARLELARTYLALNDLGAVRELLAELDVLHLARPHLGALRSATYELREESDRLQREPAAGSSLTAAELRLLPLLTTHLTFRQIAQHLYVSRNTIKTQAISVYRKLGVSSRTEAIERAVQLGLLRPAGEVVERQG